MLATAFLGIVLALNTPSGDPDRGDEYNEGYRRGFQEGFAAGYRQAAGEADKRNAAAAAAAAAAASKPSGPITGSSATYGTTSKGCNATGWLARRVHGRMSASVEVSNAICGDPAPGARKSLEIAYICGSVAKSASAYEHRTAYLDCTD